MSEDQDRLTLTETISILIGAIGGIGSALGALFAALQYAPAYTVQILVGCVAVVALVAFGLYMIFGSKSLVAKGSIGLALTFIASLGVVLVYSRRDPDVPSKPPNVQHAIEVHAIDGATLDPIELEAVKNFKIVVVNNNDTRHRIPTEEDVTQIDLSHVKIVSITACNVTTEYNVEGLKTTDKQLSLPITFVINMRSGTTCVERAR